jgi:hypothetical protein
MDVGPWRRHHRWPVRGFQGERCRVLRDRGARPGCGLELDGQGMTLAVIAVAAGVSVSSVRNALGRGWPGAGPAAAAEAPRAAEDAAGAGASPGCCWRCRRWRPPGSWSARAVSKPGMNWRPVPMTSRSSLLLATRTSVRPGSRRIATGSVSTPGGRPPKAAWRISHSAVLARSAHSIRRTGAGAGRRVWPGGSQATTGISSAWWPRGDLGRIAQRWQTTR